MLAKDSYRMALREYLWHIGIVAWSTRTHVTSRASIIIGNHLHPKSSTQGIIIL